MQGGTAVQPTPVGAGRYVMLGSHGEFRSSSHPGGTPSDNPAEGWHGQLQTPGRSARSLRGSFVDWWYTAARPGRVEVNGGVALFAARSVHHPPAATSVGAGLARRCA